jgi:UDP-N-acetyl-D-glucosamine dehydrogenase
MDRHGTVGVVGLGYVGLPLAVLAREKGWRVVGYDIDAKKVAQLARGILPFQDEQLARTFTAQTLEASNDPSLLSGADVIVVAVPTPVDEQSHPNLEPLTAAVRAVAAHAKRGVLLSIESTVNPGVCDEVVLPLLQECGRAADDADISLVHCPERVNPGDRRWTVRNIPRVLGGSTPAAVARGKAFYESVIEAPIRAMSSLRAAEAVKITENVFRDINIAFVNELAQSFDRLGIDVTEVIAGAATKPFAFMAHTPGCGVGGHCIPVDPYYLIEHAHNHGFEHRFLQLARTINKSMPQYAVERLIEAINKKTENRKQKTDVGGRRLQRVRVALLGLAYKRDVDDLRESPALEILRILEEEGADVVVFDPYVLGRSTMGSLPDALQQADAVFIATDHTAFRELSLADFAGTPVRVVLDGKNCLDPSAFEGSGILYRGIGRPARSASPPRSGSNEPARVTLKAASPGAESPAAAARPAR